MDETKNGAIHGEANLGAYSPKNEDFLSEISSSLSKKPVVSTKDKDTAAESGGTIVEETIQS